ncbi:uncharacterized protein E0L32_007390 [Thyridium curvatum]|uniref:Phosphatidic acid phosphatase type 2/haloperoxidase domain-containing protein n=1 Tax=Thyridium curvatum TaxID=1093900 RepID=A0A507APM0_9PEZI|nr:uncharacterized protein E0L32_007390 [Thyridium curvatum]TPX11892.1 hypothetical protein E0L32_007390 [Thyridium curvatum]
MVSPQNGSGSGAELQVKLNGHVLADGKDADGEAVIDAGLKSLDHYKRALPPWRYHLRRELLPLIRWETPYLAYLQSKTRSPALDTYFAVTANLGTHTFFMIGLPILFWFGYRDLGKGAVHILAFGVFFTGFIKDLCSLPRPLSPPLHRITMSGHVALEYGFPSTHSTNAVSVAVYAVLMLRETDMPPGTKMALEGLSWFYAASIVVGRLYCGMHGFTDVVVGSILGAIISYVEFYYGPRVEAYMYASSWLAPLIAVLIIIVLVRVHPEPADDCPCFDDSVAFAGVVLGEEVAAWHYARSQFAWNDASFSPVDLGWPTLLGRMVFGVLLIFGWREVMKPTLLKVLPHIFRVIENLGLNLPRRYFVQASEYKVIPEVLRLRTDNVLPGVSDLPNIVRNIKRARRGRSVSIGPQSAADAYETLAYRERRRRESIGSQGSIRSKSSQHDLREKGGAGSSSGGTAAAAAAVDDRDGNHRSTMASGVQQGPLAQYEEMMGQGTVVMDSAAPPPLSAAESREQQQHHLLHPEDDEPDMFIGRQDELGEKEIFERLTKPRVRYDVEVVTKLVVYAGIGLLAVEVIPVLFEFVGLGAEHLRPR